jgi:hypothetical protein
MLKECYMQANYVRCKCACGHEIVMEELVWQAFFDRKCPQCDRFIVDQAEEFKGPLGSILVWGERQMSCIQMNNNV